eukprot:6458148-Pyramimonas_sp.AAC.1
MDCYRPPWRAEKRSGSKLHSTSSAPAAPCADTGGRAPDRNRNPVRWQLPLIIYSIIISPSSSPSPSPSSYALLLLFPPPPPPPIHSSSS